MGTFDIGILDNDCALDGLGDLAHSIVEDIVALSAKKRTATSAETLGAAVGVLLQLSPYDFDLTSANGPKIVAALQSQSEAIAALPAAARKLLGAVADGKGKELAARDGKRTALDNLLAAGGKTSRFAPRHKALFATSAAEKYVQTIAKRCTAAIDEDFEDEDNWSDLCREGMGMGHLAALTVLAPCKVAPSKITRWRKLAQKGIDELREREDDELDFHAKYYANLDKVYAFLLKRFSDV